MEDGHDAAVFLAGGESVEFGRGDFGDGDRTWECLLQASDELGVRVSADVYGCDGAVTSFGLGQDEGRAFESAGSSFRRQAGET